MYLLSDKKREALKKYLWSKNQRWTYENILWEKVEKYQSMFSHMPWVKAICICNSLAMNACHPESDIDLFIITERNRLWTARICLTILTTLLGIRKTKHKHAGTFCLSFFVSLDEKNFSHIALQNDIYFSYWLETLIPVINKNNAFERFLKSNKITNTRHKVISESSLFTSEERIKGWRGWILNILWDINEYILKKIFLPKTLRSYKKLGKPFWVIITDSILKFHNHDKRKKIRDALM